MPFYVTDPVPADNLTTDTGDNLVTSTGDNLTAAGDGLADNITPVYIGNVAIASAYAGNDGAPIKRYGYDPVQILTLTSGEDVNLATWLGTQGADPAKPVIINFGESEIIGGTVDNAPALDLGDLSAYVNITLNINGQIQGKSSYDAIWVQNDIDVINGGTISGAIGDGVDVDGAVITLVVSSTGKILGGGGNGGAGGRGGVGSFLPDTCTSQPQGGSNSGGAGGAGGNGAGYTIPRSDGLNGGGSGSTGNCAACGGQGGNGGDGGDWGVAGSDGSKGKSSNGSYPCTTVRAGAAGVVGLPAGSAIISTSVVNIYGANSPQAAALGL